MKFAVIRIRGINGVQVSIRTALTQLGLDRKHTATLVDEKDARQLQKVKDYVTWGEANEETIAFLKEKKHLHPPIGGWKASIKKPAPKGALGKRKDINEIIKKMSC